MAAGPDPSVTRIAGPWRHLDIHANGIRFHVVEAEPAAGDRRRHPDTARPLVILLHGFGSFWWSWRHQLRGLPALGWWRSICAGTAAATSHRAATTVGRWPGTPRA